MGRRSDRDQAFLFGVAVEAGHGAQPASDGGPGPAQGLEVAGETLDIGTTRPNTARWCSVHDQATYGVGTRADERRTLRIL
jgi:hypothetical protein